jgi:glutathione S-transferase
MKRTLYHDWRSSYSWKVRLVLAEKSLEYESVVLDVHGPPPHRHKEKWFLELNPVGEVPVLVDDGFAIYDSTVIIEYLEDRYPERPLFPESVEDRARARMLENYRDLHFHNSKFVPLMREMRLKPKGTPDPEVVDRVEAVIFSEMERLEALLQGKDWFFGELSIADIAFVPNFAYWEFFDLTIPNRFERLQAWWSRWKARPSFDQAYGFLPRGIKNPARPRPPSA